MFFLLISITLFSNFCYSMIPTNTENHPLDLRSQLLVSGLSEDGGKPTQSEAKNSSKQLRLLFDVEKNCLYCAMCRGLKVKKSFPLPFYTQPCQAVTDVNVYGFDFIKPGIIFAIILAKKQLKNDTAFFMSIDLEKKLHTVWESSSPGSFTWFNVWHHKNENYLSLLMESIISPANYTRSAARIYWEQPNRPLEYECVLSAPLFLTVKSLGNVAP